MTGILLVSYHFPPSSAIGAQRPERLARLLPEFGYQVDVICAAPDSGEPWAGMVPTASSEEQLQVWRKPVPFAFGRDPRSLPRREALWAKVWWKARAYTEAVFLTGDWTWRWGQAACRELGPQIIRSGYKVMILEAPPNPSIVPFARLARRHGIPFVLDLRDTWQATSASVPWWGWVLPSLRRGEWNRKLRKEVIRAADHVIAVSLPMMEGTQETFPELPRSAFSAITNAYGQVDRVPQSYGNDLAGRRLRVAYTGSLAYGRDTQLGNLVRGMAAAHRRGGPEVELTVAGGGGESLERLAEQEGLGDRVRVLGWIPQEAAIELQRESEILLLLQPMEAAGDSIPGKLFEYMARRRNILGLVGDGVAASLIREHDLGIAAMGESPREVEEALAEITARVRARPFLPPPPEQFSERHTVSQFARVLDKLLAGRRDS